MKSDYYIMWLSHIKGIGIKKINKLIEYFGRAEEIYKAEKSDLKAALNEEDASNIVKSAKDVSLDYLVKNLRRAGAEYISMYNDAFPEGLKSIDDIPSGIYYKGKLPAKNAVLVSMVGSRRCTEYGKQAALKLSGDLAERGISIVSGLADGIDSYSHIGALRHKGITIAVMGTSIDRCYPAANISLMEEIIKNDGCIISEYGPYRQTYASDFVRRNRIIAGMSRALVVVEAEFKSGTSSTVDAALKYGREVLAVPGSIFNKYSEGTNALIRDGCHPALSFEDILNEIGIEKVKSADCRKNNIDLEDIDEEGRKIIKSLSEGEKDFETLWEETGIDKSKIMTELTILEIRKLIQKMPGQRYRLVLRLKRKRRKKRQKKQLKQRKNWLLWSLPQKPAQLQSF